MRETPHRRLLVFRKPLCMLSILGESSWHPSHPLWSPLPGISILAYVLRLALLICVFLSLSLCVCPAADLFPSPRLHPFAALRGPLRPPGRWETPEPASGCSGAFIPIQVAAIQYRIYGDLTLGRQEGTARLMGWAGWGNNRLFDVTGLIGS